MDVLIKDKKKLEGTCYLEFLPKTTAMYAGTMNLYFCQKKILN